MSIALIWNTFITCHFSIWIFESFISGSHSSLYPFSFLLWRAWGGLWWHLFTIFQLCTLRAGSGGRGVGVSVSHWSGLWPQVPAEWGQRPHLAFPCPASASLLPHPLPSSSFFTSTVIQYFSFHFFSVFGRTVWLVWLVHRPGNEPRPLAMKAQSPNHWTARELLNVKFFLFSLQLLVFEMCSPHLTLWCQTTVTIVRFCYCMFPLMISGETVSILLSFRQDQNSVFKCTE